MAYTLTEAAVVAPNPLAKGVIQTVANNPLFEVLPFIPVDGNAYSYVRTASLSDAEFRAINAGYTESTPTFTSHVAELKRLGGDADVDEFLIRTQSGATSVEDLQAAAVVAKSEAVRRKYLDTLINGDGTAESFEGLESFGITEVTGPEDSFGATADTRQDMFDAVDELLGSVVGGASALIMRAQTLAKFRSAGRREGALQDVDNFGRSITSYAGVPLVDAGHDEDGNPIITTDDIYAVRFDAASGVAGITNGGIQVRQLGELDAKPSRRVRIEFYCGLVMLHPEAAAVLRATNAIP